MGLDSISCVCACISGAVVAVDLLLCENVLTSSLQASVLPNFKSCVFSSKTLHLWHARLGHVNFQYLCLLFLLLKQACHDCHFKCVVCELSKHTRSSYLPRINRAPTAFHIIHSDVWGPSPVTAASDHHYYVMFIDDYTRT